MGVRGDSSKPKPRKQTKMNTEHYKAASERTDADERALIPAIKRTPTHNETVSDTTGYSREQFPQMAQDLRKSAVRTETGKAHSPLPWKIMADPSYPEGLHPLHHHRYIATEAMGVEGDDFDGEGLLICAMRDLATQEADAKLIVASVNHADKLAEALRELFKQCAMVHKYWGENCNQAEADAAVTLANSALHAYEAAQ